MDVWDWSSSGDSGSAFDKTRMIVSPTDFIPGYGFSAVSAGNMVRSHAFSPFVVSFFLASVIVSASLELRNSLASLLHSVSQKTFHRETGLPFRLAKPASSSDWVGCPATSSCFHFLLLLSSNAFSLSELGIPSNFFPVVILVKLMSESLNSVPHQLLGTSSKALMIANSSVRLLVTRSGMSVLGWGVIIPEPNLTIRSPFTRHQAHVPPILDGFLPMHPPSVKRRSSMLFGSIPFTLHYLSKGSNRFQFQ